MNSQSLLKLIPGGQAPQAAFPSDRPGYFAAGRGVPVVMLHSSLSSKSQWAGLAERLSARFRVIALDLCGYGDRPLPSTAENFTLDEEVRLVAGHLDRLVDPGQHAHLIGHSYGGLVALRFAQAFPGRVASLSLYEPVVFRLLERDDPALADIRQLAGDTRRLLARGHRQETAEAFVDFWSGDGSYAALSPTAQASIARRTDKLPLDFQAALQWPASPDELCRITAPTLLLAGAYSLLAARRIVSLLAEKLPRSRVRWINSGHMGPLTDGHLVNPTIETFLESAHEDHFAPPCGIANVLPF